MEPISKVFTSFSISEVCPTAVIMLNSPTVSLYEQSIYLDIWMRYNRHNLSKSSNQMTSCNEPALSLEAVPNSTEVRRPFFVCADGGWACLSKDYSSTPQGSHTNTCNEGKAVVLPTSPSPSAGESLSRILSEFPLPFDIICGDFDSQDDACDNTADTPLVRTMRANLTAHSNVIETSHISELTNDQLQVLRDSCSMRGDGSGGTVFSLKVSDQDTTDFGKCVHLVKRLLGLPPLPCGEKGNVKNHKKDMLPVVLVLGALGGRIDHTMGALWLLIKERDDLRVIIHDKDNTIFACCSQGKTTFLHDPAVDGDTCGVMVFGTKTDRVATRGLKWNLGPALGFPTGFLSDCLSTSNKIEGISLKEERERSAASDCKHNSSLYDYLDNCDHFGFVEIDTTEVENGGVDSGVLFSVVRK
eukprot:Tbor_TRINITY_DN5695_c3_g2::TRINITY_DN5695_c3_g2_i1::g.8799::m.8799